MPKIYHFNLYYAQGIVKWDHKSQKGEYNTNVLLSTNSIG